MVDVSPPRVWLIEDREHGLLWSEHLDGETGTEYIRKSDASSIIRELLVKLEGVRGGYTPEDYAKNAISRARAFLTTPGADHERV